MPLSLLTSKNWLKTFILTLYCRKFRGFIEKRKMSFSFSIIKIPSNFICSQPKLISGIYQKGGSLDGGKNDLKSTEDVQFLNFSQNTTNFKEKRKIFISFSIIKNKIPADFAHLRIKNDFGNMSESDGLRIALNIT